MADDADDCYYDILHFNLNSSALRWVNIWHLFLRLRLKVFLFSMLGF